MLYFHYRLGIQYESQFFIVLTPSFLQLHTSYVLSLIFKALVYSAGLFDVVQRRWNKVDMLWQERLNCYIIRFLLLWLLPLLLWLFYIVETAILPRYFWKVFALLSSLFSPCTTTTTTTTTITGATIVACLVIVFDYFIRLKKLIYLDKKQIHLIDA